jgi:hypothetical protein
VARMGQTVITAPIAATAGLLDRLAVADKHDASRGALLRQLHARHASVANTATSESSVAAPTVSPVMPPRRLQEIPISPMRVCGGAPTSNLVRRGSGVSCSRAEDPVSPFSEAAPSNQPPSRRWDGAGSTPRNRPNHRTFSLSIGGERRRSWCSVRSRSIADTLGGKRNRLGFTA